MPDYEKMYHLLFNAITDALEQIESQNYGNAKAQLISAQQKAEEIYITAKTKKAAPQSGERSNAAPSEERGG